MTAAARFQTSLDRLMAHSDRDVRLQAARCVGRLPGPAIIARLRRLADDLDVHVRREALRSLADRAPAAGRTTLRRAFAEDADLECRRAALRGLVLLRDVTMLPVVRRLLRNPDAFIYAQSPATQASRQALCCEAVAALSCMGDPSVVPDLMALLDHHVSPQLDDAVIRTLAHLGDSGRDAIAQVVREAPPHRARSAVDALAACDDSGGADALAIFLNHEEPSIRRAAATALAGLDSSHSALLRRCYDVDAGVRALVAAHAGPTMPSVLELLLDDPAPMVVAAALGGLAQVPEAERPADCVWRVRRKTRSDDTQIACRALETLVAIAPATAATELTARLGDADTQTSVRLKALRLLLDGSGTELAPLLFADLFDGDRTLRVGVLDALLELARREGGGSIVARLLGLLRDRGEPQAMTPRRDRSRASAVALGVADAVAGLPIEPANQDDASGIRRQVRVEIAERLGALATPAVATALATVVRDTADTALRHAAALSLAEAVEIDGDVSGIVLDVAETLRTDEAPSLRLAGIRILGTAADPTQQASLIGALEDPDPAVRACAARWVGAVSQPIDVAVLDRLERGLGDRNTSVRLATMGALVARRGDQAAGLIIDSAIVAGDEIMPAVVRCLAKLDPEAVHRELARRLARAWGRDRQLALLRLSDAILAASVVTKAA